MLQILIKPALKFAGIQDSAMSSDHFKIQSVTLKQIFSELQAELWLKPLD